MKARHCLNHLKKQRRHAAVELDEKLMEQLPEFSTRPAVEIAHEREHRREQVKQVLDAMADTLRIPLILCDMDGLSYEQIANTLEISLSAAKMRIKRAREEFRRRYQPGPRSPEASTREYA